MHRWQIVDGKLSKSESPPSKCQGKRRKNVKTQPELGVGNVGKMIFPWKMIIFASLDPQSCPRSRIRIDSIIADVAAFPASKLQEDHRGTAREAKMI